MIPKKRTAEPAEDKRITKVWIENRQKNANKSPFSNQKPNGQSSNIPKTNEKNSE